MKKILSFGVFALLALSFSSCHIYKKYELPKDAGAIVDNYAKALEEKVDSATLPYLGWKDIFTDPILQDYIERALTNNKDLNNARLNVDIANAQLKGAKLSYFPSVAINPNGGASSYAGSRMNWTYTIPAAVSWEIDVFAKILNRKRGAKANVEMSEDYRQAVHSQIVCGVANVYYSLVMLHQQLDLTKATSEIWEEQVASMELLKDAGRTNEAAVVQSRANYYSIKSTIPVLENSINQLQNTLSLLLNEYPYEWKVTDNLSFIKPKHTDI